MEEQKRLEAGGGGEGATGTTPAPPPIPTATPAQEAAILGGIIGDLLEDQSIQDSMDKNKESLKRKLMLRRSVTELVDQGIYPPLKAPAAFAEQRKHLERAKTGDLLRQKLKMRPDRQSLVQHHILEDTNVDPSLQDRQKLLKKARLQDSLNDRLANRPGPLELVEGNILETDPELKDAIKEGKLQFTKTSELGEPARRKFGTESEDGNTSEGALSPVSSEADQASPITIPTPPDITPLLQTRKQTGMMSPAHTITFTPISSPTVITSPPAGLISHDVKLSSALSPPSMSSGSSTSSQASSSSSSASLRLARLKKQKSKTPSKNRVIKFHEYKGPPNLVKSQPPSSPPSTMAIAAPTIPTGSDTPYNILLQQQQLLLQWQLQMRQTKNVSIFLPPGQKQVLAAATATATSSDGGPVIQQVQLQQVAPPTSSGQKIAAGKTIITPVGTPIPLSQSSPASTPATVVPPPTIVASIPAALPANAIPASKPVTTTVNTSMIVTTATTLTAVTATISKPNNKDNNMSKLNNNSSSKSSSTNNNTRPPITKLDDLKVAELKAECRNRNLPVSGPKPNLLDKLKPYADEIVASWKAMQGGHTSPNNSTSSFSSVTNINENSLTSPASVQSITSINHMINLQPLTPINDDAMSLTFGSPPMSPLNQPQEVGQVATPPAMSPVAMDVMSPTTAQPGQMIAKEPGQPMLIEVTSRPPSAIPMDVELSGSQTNLTTFGTDLNMNPKNEKLSKHAGGHQQAVTSPPASLPPPPPPPPLPPPPAPPLPQQVITIRPHQTQTSQPLATQVQPGQIQIHPGSQPGHLQLQGTLQNPQFSQIRAQLLQQMVVRLPTSSSTTAQVAVSRVQSVNGQSGSTISLSQPRPLLAQVQQVTNAAGKTVNVIQQARPLVQISRPSTQPTQTVATGSNAQVITAVQNPQVASNQVQLAAPISSGVQQIGQPPVISNEELVKQQQKQIEELRRQLLQYQQRLNDAQQKANQHSERLKVHLAQAQVQGPDQAKAQQQAQLQAQALAQAQAQVQAIQQQAQIQVQAAAQPISQALKAEKNSTASLTVASPQSSIIVASPGQSIAQSPSMGGSPLKAMNPSPAQAVSVSRGPTPSPAQMMAPSPVQMVAPSPAQIVAPSPVPMMAPSPAPAVSSAMPQTPSPKTILQATNPLAAQTQSLPQTIVVQQSPHSIVAPSSNSVSKTVTSVPLNNLIQGQTLHHNLNMGHKLILSNGQQVILSSQPGQSMLVQTSTSNKPGKATIVQLNGLNTANNKSSSVPSSPIGHSKVVRSNTNPFFPVPLKEPPKYDEAIKNKQNVLLLQAQSSQSSDTAITNVSLATTSPVSSSQGNPSNSLASIKNEYVDDVLDILIRNGELPPSAAQDPPPSLKVSNSSAKPSSSTQSVSSPEYLSSQNADLQATLASMSGLQDNMSSILNSIKLEPGRGLTDAESVLSIANGLKLSGPFSSGAGLVGTSGETPITTLSRTGTQYQVVNSSAPTMSCVMSPSSKLGSPLFNHTSPIPNLGSPHGSDSGVSSASRKDPIPALSLSPAISHTGSTLTESHMVDLPFMEWSDSDFQDTLLDGTGANSSHCGVSDQSDSFLDNDTCMDTDDKDLIKELNKPAPHDDLNCDFFTMPSISVVSQETNSVLSPPHITPPSTSIANGIQSSPNLRELGFNDMDMMDPTADMTIDVSDWLDVVMPPSGLTPTTVHPPANTCSSDPILTPKTEDFLDLFNLVESDLCTPTDHGSSLCFESSVMEASTSKT